MNVAEWILVVLLSVTLLIFLVSAIVLIIKLIFLAEEAKKIVQTGQGIAAKADDIINNVKGMTSVGGIVKTFANRVMENQERRYAEEDAARAAAAEEMAKEAAAAEKEARAAVRAGAKVKAAASKVKSAASSAAKAAKK